MMAGIDAEAGGLWCNSLISWMTISGSAEHCVGFGADRMLLADNSFIRTPDLLHWLRVPGQAITEPVSLAGGAECCE